MSQSRAKQISEKHQEQFDFGDQRINRRANKLMDSLSQRSEQTLSQALCKKADYEAALRFFDNNLVEPNKILTPHFEATYKRCNGLDLVAVVQDSSDLDFDYLDIEEFGPMSSNVQQGFRIHPSLVITEAGVPLGLVGYKAYTRDEKQEVKSTHRNCLKIEQKESFRWLEGYRHACSLAREAGENTTVVSISDREGDIYEIFAEAEDALAGNKAHVLIRAQHNRRLDGECEDNLNRLEKKLCRSPVVGQAEVTVASGLKNERRATVNLRACSVLIRAPQTAKKKQLRSIAVNAIMVSETDRTVGTDSQSALYWILLTTLPIDSADDLHRLVALYARRWQIEVYFTVLKSGSRINKTRLHSRNRIENLIAFCMLVAWRVMLATYLSREYPEVACTVVYTEKEWKLAYLALYEGKKALPSQPPTLKEMTQLVATLGGYKKNKAPPGIITVWRGISRVIDMVYGHELSNKYLAGR